MRSILASGLAALLGGSAVGDKVVAAAPVAAGDDQTDAGYELLVTSTGAAIPRTCYPAPGLPAFAQGSYFIGGPALFELGGYKYQGIFDGLGKMNRFELGRGEICYTSAWLNTGMYQEAKKDGLPPHGILFEDTSPPMRRCPLLDPVCNLVAPNDNNWVSMIEVGDELLLLSDTSTMVRMDPETLNCSGVKQWADDTKTMTGQTQPSWIPAMHTGAVGSAHPLRRPGSNTWVDIIVEMKELPLVGKNGVDVYSFEGSVVGPQNRKKLASIQTDNVQYMHSFGVTPNYVVLPLNMQTNLKILGQPTLLGSFSGSWKGISVVGLQGDVQVFDTEPFFHVHMVNAFENATGIVMDLGFYKVVPFSKSAQMDVSLFLNKTARDTNPTRSGVRRLHLHLSGPMQGKTTFQDFVTPGRSMDFYKVNPALSGLPYCVYYANEWWHNDRDFASTAVVKHNLCTGTKAYWYRADHYPGEPFFIGDRGSEAEDAGVVVFVALDGRRRSSIFVTVDARTLEEKAVVRLPGHIPFTAHGQYLAAAAARAAPTLV